MSGTNRESERQIGCAVIGYVFGSGESAKHGCARISGQRKQTEPSAGEEMPDAEPLDAVMLAETTGMAPGRGRILIGTPGFLEK